MPASRSAKSAKLRRNIADIKPPSATAVPAAGEPEEPNITVPNERQKAPQQPTGENPPHIRRPPNAFILFRANFVREKHEINMVGKDVSLSGFIGDLWRNLPDNEKSVWQKRAEKAKEDHSINHPNYKYKPVHTEHTVENKNKNKNKKRPVKRERNRTKTSGQATRHLNRAHSIKNCLRPLVHDDSFSFTNNFQASEESNGCGSYHRGLHGSSMLLHSPLSTAADVGYLDDQNTPNHTGYHSQPSYVQLPEWGPHSFAISDFFSSSSSSSTAPAVGTSVSPLDESRPVSPIPSSILSFNHQSYHHNHSLPQLEFEWFGQQFEPQLYPCPYQNNQFESQIGTPADMDPTVEIAFHSLSHAHSHLQGRDSASNSPEATSPSTSSSVFSSPALSPSIFHTLGLGIPEWDLSSVDLDVPDHFKFDDGPFDLEPLGLYRAPDQIPVGMEINVSDRSHYNDFNMMEFHSSFNMGAQDFPESSQCFFKQDDDY